MEIKKVNNLFICHRPYHVVVSAHIINHNIQNSNKTVKNTCVLLDVPVFNKNTSPGGQISFDELTNSSSLNKIDYIHFDHLYRLEKIFDKVLKINRYEEVRIWNIFKFKEYYKSLIRNIKKIFSNSELNSINNIYIFSDKEKPVEIIASILKEKYSSKVFLVDEGIVSYYKNKSYFKSLIKRFIVKAFRLKYISNSMAYGHSGINDYFLTFDKKDVINQKNIIQLPILDSVEYKHIFKDQYPTVGDNTALFISNALSEGNVLSIEDEKLFITKIISELIFLGYNVLIKPHPVEVKWKFIFLDKAKMVKIMKESSLPVEMLFNDNNIKILTGVTSSALLNAKRNNKVAISFIKYLNEDHPIIDIYQKNEKIGRAHV